VFSYETNQLQQAIVIDVNRLSWQSFTLHLYFWSLIGQTEEGPNPNNKIQTHQIWPTNQGN